MPSSFEVVPSDVPLTVTETPTSGVPDFSSVIFPEIVLFCAMRFAMHRNKHREVSKIFLIRLVLMNAWVKITCYANAGFLYYLPNQWT